MINDFIIYFPTTPCSLFQLFFMESFLILYINRASMALKIPKHEPV